MIKNNVQNKVDRSSCTGCGLCVSVCHQKAIKLVEHDDGFLYPNISINCDNCGVCLNSCPIDHLLHSPLDSDSLSAYSYRLSDRDELRKSASGGAATAMMLYELSRKGIIYTCSYDSDFKSSRIIKINEKSQLQTVKGSKYCESMPPNYVLIKNELKLGAEILFIGLPCQIAALKKYTGETDNLITVGLICTGKGSRILLRKNTEFLVKKFNSRILSFNERFKKKNWLVPWMNVTFENGKKCSRILGNTPYGMLCHKLIRRSCFDCKYKISNAPEDILIGDAWGAEVYSKKAFDSMGCSLIIGINEKGKKYVSNIKGIMEEISLDEALKCNHAIDSNTIKDKFYNVDIQMLHTNSLEEIVIKNIGVRGMLLNNIRNTLKYILPVPIVKTILRKKHSF
ncbi:Coenzyme F420-reducing hydrogenase, beta subunit [Oribacterium sp. KHPX15]|uniref:Coenzyme F420 hydrogenase/dehydrogenase, beta subunit C-terminal domain n=1 Tax=Oribacterium sp. KHPX15 TaxID=1855342 RepID=UPI000895ADEC|nr:Coenzyme F420 hydrogenase/dehydrogenase, beta subunit C-terminal domain [Oribacterium sp. KHPX15]SEA81543.1 Coenzyme F420-reducing hydrogenase, beta subunit [Oribacterium sp. KHPX15]